MKSSLQLVLIRLYASLAIVIALVLVPCSATSQDEIAPDKADARRLCATNTWAVWQTSELVESTRGYRAESYVHRFYRQRLSEPRAHLFHTRTDTRTRMLATVTTNGTVALVSRKRLSWYKRNGESVTEPIHVNVLGLYPDGILRGVVHHEPIKPGQRTPSGIGHKMIFFIPFKNDRLDMPAQVKLLTLEFETYHGGGVYPRVARHGRQFAWILLDVRKRKVSSPTDAWDATLHVHDTDSGEQWAVKLSRLLHRSCEVTAFDGDVVKVFRSAFDARTGQNLFAARNRIGYYVSNQSLYATDLRSSKRPTIKLASVPRPSDCAKVASGIRVRNGREWKTIPWLTEWPQSDR